MVEENLSLLKNADKDLRLKGAEELRDLYEFEYQYKSPEASLVTKIVDGLTEAILIEKDENTQLAQLDALYAWSWFPSESDYDKLANKLDMLLSESCVAQALEILIATGSVRYEKLYSRCSLSESALIRNTAGKGLKMVHSR